MRSRLRLAILIYSFITCCFVSMHAIASDPPVGKSTVSNATYRLSYGNGPAQFAELRIPQGSGPFPIAIIIHGGCWVSKYADYQSTVALSEELRNLGIATWNIEYRTIDNGGGWPGTFLDVGHAADYLTKIAKTYSLDLNRVIAVGHSAGGHLALWLAGRHNLPVDSKLFVKNPIALRGVVSLGGVPDLKAFRELGKKVCETDVVSALLDNRLDDQLNHYREGSPKELLPLGVTQILIYGANDVVVPAALGRQYQKMANAKRDKVELIEIKNAGHHEYIIPNSLTWPTVKLAILSLLNLKTQMMKVNR